MHWRSAHAQFAGQRYFAELRACGQAPTEDGIEHMLINRVHQRLPLQRGCLGIET